MALSDPNLPDAPLVYVNPAFSALTGYSPAEAVGRNCRFLQGPDTDPAAVARLREAVAAHASTDEEIYNYRKDGSGFWNALHLSPVFDEDGRLIYYFASQIDVSARKEAARRQAQRVESMGALASGVAHEFNNLMTVVVGSVERAAIRALDERQSGHLSRADVAARRAGQLAAELLSIARRQAAANTVLDLNEVVHAFEHTLRQVAGERVRLCLDLAPEPVRARLDAEQLELVLLNLARNAVEAMPEGGNLVVGTRLLSAGEAADVLNGKAAVELFVSDTGAGMTPEVLARATELFFTTKAASKGVGLGLFLALEFADHAGGKLLLTSEAKRGTKVRLVFPPAR
jgi:PAS domain S-box-containing protein